MKAIVIVILAATMALGAGCAQSPTWQKSGATQDEFTADAKFCEYEALKAVQVASPGLQTSFGQELDMALRRKDVAYACMRAKGYETASASASSAPRTCSSIEQVGENSWRKRDGPC